MFNPFAAFSTVKIVVWLLAFNVLSAGGAYLFGRSDGRALERADMIAAGEWVDETDKVTRAELLEKARTDTERAAETETANETVADKLETPEAGDDMPGLSGEWLRKLESLR